MKYHSLKRLLSVLLVIAMLAGYMVMPVAAAPAGSKVRFTQVDNDAVSANLLNQAEELEEDAPSYADTDVVRVSIVLKEKSTIEAGFAPASIATNAAAVAYRSGLQKDQDAVTAAIEKATGEELDVVWNLTLAANIISANVPYGQIKVIEKVKGVEQVLIETRYEPDVVESSEAADPDMATSGAQIGSAYAWAAGYTGAGSRIAIIDTGVDVAHQSMDPAAFQYSLAHRAGLNGQSVEDYLAELDLLDAEEIASVADQLNVSVDPASAYINSKIPFGYSYIDGDYDVTHDNDTQGEHGSHVSGIAAANAYIPTEDGFAPALSTVFVQGVAPDAQILSMKVFGNGGGAYDSDYMAAIEDAIVLGADSVNLSLGSGNPGTSRNSNAEYQAIMESLEHSGVVVAMSAGNSGSWVENAANAGYLYADDVSMQTNGSPGSFTNSLAVASVDNDGKTGLYLSVAGSIIVYNETDYSNAPFATLAGDQEYVLIDGFGTAEDWAAVGDALVGKIAICSRGTTSFYEKAQLAVEAGAIGTFIYNNQSGIINMDLSDYPYDEPVASLTQADGAFIKANATPVADEAGNVLYYTGTMTISSGMGVAQFGSNYYTMSSFSSWGVPGSLELKPEITAPGGSIYSLNGSHAGDAAHTDHDAYEVMSGTSMASPQVAGMAAVVAQYIRENDLCAKTGLDARTLAQSLLMSTAEPMLDADGNYYPLLQQGAGLANVGNAVSADSYLLMNEDATASWADGKVKAELGDDPEGKGEYSFSFDIYNMSDSEKSFDLAADFFIQAPTMDSAYNLYMYTSTTLIGADVSWTVDGVAIAPEGAVDGMDFNGDGIVNSDDGQALLDLATGVIDTISNADKADLNADGDVDSHDAYLFLNALTKGTAVVAANDHVTVTVNVKLSAGWMATLNYYYPNGTYLQGYVYAESNASGEGVEGTCHSIPVLGFTGNWSDASMFDVGSYLEYAYGEENRMPYLGKPTANAWIVQYKGDSGSYYFGGNPLVMDETYMPERNAINSNDRIAKVQFIAIRNAAASYYYAVNKTTGEVMDEALPGAVSSAYYYANGGTWRNTGYSLNTSFSPKTAKEGDVLELGLTLAPEYYRQGVDSDGNVVMDWDALGEGATFSIEMTVDNTAPVVQDVSISLTANTLSVTAADNQYIAAAVLYNSSGSKVLTYAGADQDAEAGETSTYVMPLDGVNGKRFLLQVVDYALNTTTYEIELQIGEPEDYTGRIFGFTEGTSWHGYYNRWIEIDPENLFFYYKSGVSDFGGVSDFCNTDITVVDAEYVDGYVYMMAEDGYIYIAEQDDLSVYQKVGYYGDLEIVGMAMNYADGKMYLMTKDDGDSDAYKMTICTMDLITGEIAELYDVAVINPKAHNKTRTRLSGLAIDDDGNFYTVNYGTGAYTFVYTWTNDMAVDGKIADLHPINDTANGGMGFYGNYASLAWDHDADVLYCAAITSQSSSANNILVTIDVATGKGAKVTAYDGGYGNASYASQLRLGVNGLYIVPSANQNVGSTTTPTSIVLDKTELELLTGASVDLNVEVYPWCLNDKSVTWTSSDESVLTVDEEGVVTTVGVGAATVTVTTNATPSLSATCAITVSKLEDVALKGLIYDVDSTTYWSEFVSDELPNWNKVNGPADSYVAGGLVGDMLYLHTGDHLYGVDADTFEVSDYGFIASSWIWSDGAQAPAIAGDKLVGLCNSGAYLEILDPAAGSLAYFNLGSRFADDPMAVIAYVEDGTYLDYPAAYYYMMTESGNLWSIVIYSTTDGESFSMAPVNLGSTGLKLEGVSAVTGGAYASMEYDNATGYLLISTYLEGETAQLWAVQPESLVPANLGNFGDKVWPVVSLYQHDRVEDLNVKLSPAAVDIYAGETAAISAKIKFGTTNQLTWTSSDETVATVDANGVITGVSEGSAVITATTVDKNKAGETVSASVTVNVKGLTAVSTKVNAQINTPTGAQWVTIDTDSMTATVNGNAATAFTGAGTGSGKIYATNSNFTDACNIYQIDPSNKFAESQGSACSKDYAILDMVNVPAMMVDVTDAEGNVSQMKAFDMPVYIPNCQNLYFLTDYVEGSLTGWGTLYYYYSDLGAIAYLGEATHPTSGAACQTFAVLGADGTLYQFLITPSYNAEKGTMGYSLSRGTIGNIGVEFDNYQTLSMACDGKGLIIADSSKGAADLYYVDLTAETLSCGKIGRLNGATAITGLYTDADLATAAVASVEAVDVGAAADVQATDSVATPAAADEIPCFTAKVNEGVAPVVEAAPEAPEAEEEAPIVLRPLARQAVNVQSLQSGAVITPLSEAVIAEDHETVSVTVTAKDVDGNDVESNNGVVSVEFDPAVLKVESVAVYGDMTSQVEADGQVTLGYVSLEAIPAGAPVAVVTFSVINASNTHVTVTNQQINNVAGGSESLFVEFDHATTEIRDAKVATCTEDGYTGDTWCLDCGMLIASGEVIPATGHSYDAVVTEPTCTEAGYTTHTCANCGDSYVDSEVPATGHDYVAEITKAATCIEDGVKTYTCHCGDTYTEVIPAHGHDYDAVVTDPTCEEKGYTTHTCGICGDSYVDSYVDALGHDYVVEVVAPTYDEDGYTKHTCKACGHSYMDSVVPALGHKCAAFTDIPDNWAKEGICYVVENGLMNGMTETEFMPNLNMNRAQLVTVLYRLAGAPEVDTKAPFVDVVAGSFYEKAVDWAYGNGIVKGMTEEHFDPTGEITREQMVTFLARFAALQGEDVTPKGDLSAFSDEDEVSKFAKDAMIWAVESGLIEGLDDGTIAPKAGATRAQVATVLMRYCKAFN